MWGAIKKAINSNLNKSLDVLIAEKHLETNSKIDSKSSQSSVDAVKSLVQDGNNLIGSTNNNGGTATSGSIFAKLNKLLTDWTTTRAGYIDTTISSRATQAQIVELENIINNIQLSISNSSIYKYVPQYKNLRIVKISDRWVNGERTILTFPLNVIIHSMLLRNLEGNYTKFSYYSHIIEPIKDIQSYRKPMINGTMIPDMSEVISQRSRAEWFMKLFRFDCLNFYQNEDITNMSMIPNIVFKNTTTLDICGIDRQENSPRYRYDGVYVLVSDI